MSVNILEGIRFFVSFACSFAFVNLNLWKVQRLYHSSPDEGTTLATSQHILKAYQNHEKDKMMLKVMKDCEKEVYQMYEDAVNQKRMAEFLFKDGSMIVYQCHY